MLKEHCLQPRAVFSELFQADSGVCNDASETTNRLPLIIHKGREGEADEIAGAPFQPHKVVFF